MNRTVLGTSMRTTPPNVYPASPQNPARANAWPGHPSELNICCGQVLLVLLLLALARACGQVPYIGPIAAHGALFWQLWAPISRADTLGRPLAALGLSRRDLAPEILTAAVVAAVVLPLWALGLGALRAPLAAWGFVPPAPHTSLGGSGLAGAAVWAQLLATHVLGVALPEELFWRGYVQPVLQGRWPSQRRVFGLPLGPAAVVTCALFALGHVVGGANLMGLATFLPALLFAGLRNLRGNLVAAVLLHAACNLAAAALT